MEPGNTHLLKLTIAGLNALTVHAQESLLRRGIGIHISTLDSDYGHAVNPMPLTHPEIANLRALLPQP